MTDKKGKIQKKFDDAFLKPLDEKTPPPDFHNRFWERFEKEKDVPTFFGPAPSSFPMMQVAFASMTIFVLVGFFIAQTPDVPITNLVQGNVTRGIKSAQLTPLQKGAKIQTGDSIVTGPSDWAILELSNKYQVKIEPNSSISINKLKNKLPNSKTIFHLSRGQVLVSIGSKKPYPFEVKTPNAFARAIGTQFAVQVSSFIKPVSWVGIIEGTVQVGKITDSKVDLASAIPVTAGNEIYISEEIAKPTEREMIEAKSQELEELFQFAKKNQLILLISMSENRVNELLEPCLLYYEVDKDDKELRRIPMAAAQIGKALKSGDFSQHEKAVVKFEEAIRNQNELDQVSGLLYVGSYYAHLKKYDESVRVFEDVIKQYPNSSLRSLALMAAAKIYHEHLNNSERALELTEEIITNYPKSYEAKPAERLRHSIMAA